MSGTSYLQTVTGAVPTTSTNQFRDGFDEQLPTAADGNLTTKWQMRLITVCLAYSTGITTYLSGS
jgi:hypothetical protein